MLVWSAQQNMPIYLMPADCNMQLQGQDKLLPPLHNEWCFQAKLNSSPMPLHLQQSKHHIKQEKSSSTTGQSRGVKSPKGHYHSHAHEIHNGTSSGKFKPNKQNQPQLKSNPPCTIVLRKKKKNKKSHTTEEQ